MWNWELENWPNFVYAKNITKDMDTKFHINVGRSAGSLSSFSEKELQEIFFEILTKEVISNSAIENEKLMVNDVKSSIKHNLGFRDYPESPDPRAKGAAKLMITGRTEYEKPLSHEMLFSYHSIILGYRKDIKTGAYRSHKEDMVITSGVIGREKIIFAAPSSSSVTDNMTVFIKWFNDSAPRGKKPLDALLRASIAHLFFLAIHPFEDGNGRIGRAIAEKALSQSLRKPLTLSLSEVLFKNRKAYYDALEKTNKTLEIDDWIKFFSEKIIEAQALANEKCELTLLKGRIFNDFEKDLNERQIKTIKRLFDKALASELPAISALKHKKINRTSPASATRDLKELSDMKIVFKVGEGRATSYQLNRDIYNVSPTLLSKLGIYV